MKSLDSNHLVGIGDEGFFATMPSSSGYVVRLSIYSTAPYFS